MTDFVEVIYAPPSGDTILKKVPFAREMCVQDAINSSGLLESHPEIKDFDIGIYRKITNKDHKLKANDRVEIYRPLLICPKEKRRKRSS